MKRGFTLIELSIVLVIVALLVGGILVGKDLILVSQIRQDITTINKYRTAFYAFKNKYNCVPGDCATASEKGLGAFNGNGNGEIDNSSGNELIITCANFPANTATEFGTVIKHLVVAGMLEQEDYDNTTYLSCSKMVLRTNFSQGICAYSGYYSSTHIFKTCTTSGSANASLTTTSKVTPAIAYAIDSKIDDGKPRAGKIHGGVYQATNATGIPTYWYALCTTNASGTYEYLAGSNVMDTNSNGVDYGCPLAFYNYW